MSTGASPRYTCSVGGAISAVAGIRGGVPILHAGPGCGLQIFLGQHYGRGLQGGAHLGGFTLPCTNTSEREVVFGGETRLEETIRTTIEVMAGDFFVVLTGCTAAIIGDDVQSVVRRFRDEGVAVIAANTSGFEGNSYLGYEQAWQAMIDHMVSPLPRQAMTVNLFGVVPGQDVFWYGHLVEMSSLLEALGLRVHTFYTDRQGLAEVRASAGASLNLFLSPYLGRNIETTYTERFGIPSVRIPAIPIGPTATDAFLGTVRRALGLPDATGEDWRRRERTRAFDALQNVSALMAGLSFQHKFAVVGDAATVIGVTRFLTNDLGQIPVAALVTDNAPEESRAVIVEAVNAVDYREAVPVCFVQRQEEIEAELKRRSPTYVLGSSLDRRCARKLKALHLSVSYPLNDKVVLSRSYAGYRGGVTLVEDYFGVALNAGR
jgi:nitrogenase molybdenum-iron protein beta chain